MKKILIGLGVLVVVVIAAAVIVPSVIPVETYKQEVVARIEQATGRKARIEGEFGFSVLPNLEFTAGKVALANAPGVQPADMVTLDKLNVRVALFPLISGNIVVDSFVLEKPVIDLMVDRNGKPNWQFETAKAKAGASTATAEKGKAPSSGGGGPGLSGLTLGDVRIVDGRLVYRDQRTGQTQRVDGINMKVSLPSMSSPMKADGSLVWNKEKVTLTLNVANPNAFLNGKRTGLGVEVASSPVTLSFNGNAASHKVMQLGGKLDLDVPSVRKLAAWAGSPLDAPGTGLGPLKIAGTVAVDGAKAAFKEATFALDDIKGSGDFQVDTGGKRPSVGARMALGMVDLNPYLPPEGAKGAGGKGAASKGGGASAPAASQGWSDEPLDLAGLKAADASLDLRVDGLIARKIKVGKSQVKVALKNGRMQADLTEMALYGGRGKAGITVDAATATPSIALSMDLAGFEANPFLKDAADMDRLEGKANADLSVTGRGKTQRQIVSVLNGKGSVKFLDGAIRGINLAAMVRNVKSAFLDAGAREQQKTDFAELGGTFTIRNGIVTNNDLEMKSPLLRIAGKGTVNLPQRTVNYRIEPKAVASTKGQGGKADIAGITVPVIVTGSWDNLSYRPDLSGMVKGVVKGKGLEQLQKVIPGAGGKTDGQGGSTPAVPSPGDALKKLFGK